MEDPASRTELLRPLEAAIVGHGCLCGGSRTPRNVRRPAHACQGERASTSLARMIRRNTMPKTLKDVLAEAGTPMDFESGGHSPSNLVDREVKREPHARVSTLKDIYMDTLSSANNEFPYWYTREYALHDTEIPVVRRAMALKSAFAHCTPVIFPGELLVTHKASFFRGSFPMPWLSEGYY